MRKTESSGWPSISVVVPSAGRRDSLERLLARLADEDGLPRAEVIVVDDRSAPDGALLPPAPTFHVVRSGGRGPARARNVGWRAARAEVILFADDDVLPHPGWMAAAVRRLERESALVSVEGRVLSPPFDPLFEQSVRREDGGWGLTCNVAYRRRVLEELEGFDEGFPYPHCEDLDLHLRARRHGPIAFEPSMAVDHLPRPLTLRSLARLGSWAPSEMRLEARHPGTFPRPRFVPARLGPVWTVAAYWRRVLGREGVGALRPRRAWRIFAGATVHIVTAAYAALRA